MSRKPSSTTESIDRALKTVAATLSAIELRRALSVVLPVLHGLSLRETAVVLGRSETWVAKERQNFIRDQLRQTDDRPKGGRRNQLIPADEEDAFMDSVCWNYARIHAEWRLGLMRVQAHHKLRCLSFDEFVKVAIEERIQRKTTRTTAYNLMARTGKRRFVDYAPHMWWYACWKELPPLIYKDEHLKNEMIKKFGLSRRKLKSPTSPKLT